MGGKELVKMFVFKASRAGSPSCSISSETVNCARPH